MLIPGQRIRQHGPTGPSDEAVDDESAGHNGSWFLLSSLVDQSRLHRPNFLISFIPDADRINWYKYNHGYWCGMDAVEPYGSSLGA